MLARLLRIVGYAHAEELIHIRAKAAIGQMGVENPDKFRPTGAAAFLAEVLEQL